MIVTKLRFYIITGHAITGTDATYISRVRVDSVEIKNEAMTNIASTGTWAFIGSTGTWSSTGGADTSTVTSGYADFGAMNGGTACERTYSTSTAQRRSTLIFEWTVSTPVDVRYVTLNSSANSVQNRRLLIQALTPDGWRDAYSTFWGDCSVGVIPRLVVAPASLGRNIVNAPIGLRNLKVHQYLRTRRLLLKGYGTACVAVTDKNDVRVNGMVTLMKRDADDGQVQTRYATTREPARFFNLKRGIYTAAAVSRDATVTDSGSCNDITVT